MIFTQHDFRYLTVWRWSHHDKRAKHALGG